MVRESELMFSQVKRRQRIEYLQFSDGGSPGAGGGAGGGGLGYGKGGGVGCVAMRKEGAVSFLVFLNLK